MKIWAWLIGILAFILASAAGYTALTLNVSYSEGERAGFVQKISHKGWICKTYEGEIAMSAVPGVAPTIWYFTVPDAAVAKQIQAAVGQYVTLHYQEHKGVPTSCFGDTMYYVTKVTQRTR